MNKDYTILYNIAYQDGYAARLIPELDYCGNALPRRFDKQGETIELFLNDTIDKITAHCSSPFVTLKVNKDSVSITFDTNTTTATRQARITIYRTDGGGVHKMLQFVVHQK